MRYIRCSLLAIAVLAFGASTAYAEETSTDAQTQARIYAVSQVQSQAAELGEAPTPTKAKADQKALQPAVDHAIEVGAGLTLQEKEGENPSVLADLARRSSKVRHVHPAPTKLAKPTEAPTGNGESLPYNNNERATTARRVTAHSAGCYGQPSDQAVWTSFGATIGWLYARENGWCGDGYRITWYGGPTFAKWSWGPYCFSNHSTQYTWDGYPTWIHMGNFGSFGVSYAWGCYGIHGGHAVVRIAANGYWDRYDDFGF